MKFTRTTTRSVVAGLSLVSALTLTACNGDGMGVRVSTSTIAVDPSAGSGGSVVGVDKCRTDGLEISASDSTVEGDRDSSVAVTLTNGSGLDCAISGYAGVDLTTGEGDLSARRTGRASAPRVLKDGDSVAFGITYPAHDAGGSGIHVTGLVVTPPHETESVTLDWPGASTLASPVEVGPVGSAGQ
ncbi:DUF4232 domain-containing protein [Streptomyces formicae]|uniref:Glycine-rich secreted protein n=1 Tax=Streptomyces formicae TaxID=1616117 RepID=A0A291QDK9_9ACTN|nr:DUF4232 domain-containing protein [Streptomyces formicae]ATL29564.1 glycine-rich secreted protein [Streptomyces formicae]